jgi:hypothetical protein
MLLPSLGTARPLPFRLGVDAHTEPEKCGCSCSLQLVLLAVLWLVLVMLGPGNGKICCCFRTS